MITNATQLDLSIKQLRSFRNMLEAMRVRLSEQNSSLFPTVAKGYLSKIEQLEDDIISFLRENPAESPLTIKIQGPNVKHGIIKASLAGKIISGIQAAVYQLGGAGSRESERSELAEPKVKGLRTMLGLDLVATHPGSFILALDTRWEQRPLFPEFDPAIKAIEKLIEHINEIEESPESYTGDRPSLKGLKKISEVIKAGVESIEIDYHVENYRANAAITPVVRDRIDLLLGAPKQGEKTIRGNLIAIDTENNTCIVHPTDQPRVSCDYDETLEDDLVSALRREIEMAGEIIPLDRPAGHFKITKIERFRVIETSDDD